MWIGSYFKRYTLLGVAVCIVSLIGIHILNTANLNMLYAVMSGFILANFIMALIYYGKEWRLILGSLYWYAMFWTVHGYVFGFHAQTHGIEEALSMLPAILAILYSSTKHCKWHILATLATLIYSLTMIDTPNIVLATVCIYAVLEAKGDKKVLLISLAWYQIVLTLSIIRIEWLSTTLYVIALLPYITVLVYLLLVRLVEHE